MIDSGGGVLPVPVDWVVQGGAAGLLAVGVLMLFFGLLVPRRVVKDLERDRDYWRETALTAMGHTEVLLPAAQITTEVTRALSDASTNRRVGGGS